MNIAEFAIVGLAVGQIVHALFHITVAGMGIHEVYYHSKKGGIKSNLWKIALSVAWTILCIGLLVIDWHEHSGCAR